MVTEQEFRTTFSDEGLSTFDPAVAATLGLPAEEVNWLTNVGLPKSAAPFFSFGDDSERGLPAVGEIFRGARNLPPANRYRVIGSTGEGDPVVLDLAARGAIVYLDHENRFARVLVNSSVRQLATCLAAYTKPIAATQAANGEDAFLDGNVPASMLDAVREQIRDVDAAALEPGTMWAAEIESLTGDFQDAPKRSWWRRLLGGAG